MKKYNPKAFLLGIAFSVLLFSIYSFTEKQINLDSLSAQTELVPVDPATAQSYINNFATLNPNELKAVNISLAQWQAINQVVAERGNSTSNLSGFRLYFGSTSTQPNSSLVSLAYTINSNLNENPPGNTVIMAEGFSRSYSQQCPPFCD